jgi:hypothetical protein
MSSGQAASKICRKLYMAWRIERVGMLEWSENEPARRRRRWESIW